ncbi:MAG: 2-oxoacid:ferredoxin oxidoreductase subunit beta, partial [Bacteroidetes bacterium]
HGEPMIFGKEKNKGLVLDGLKLKIVTIGENGVSKEDILVHDAHEKDPSLHLALINMQYPDFPVAFGVIRAVEAHTYDERVEAQIKEVQETAKIKNVDDLLKSGSTWEVE